MNPSGDFFSRNGLKNASSRSIFIRLFVAVSATRRPKGPLSRTRSTDTDRHSSLRFIPRSAVHAVPDTATTAKTPINSLICRFLSLSTSHKALTLSHSRPSMASVTAHSGSKEEFIIRATRHNSVYLHVIPRLSAGALLRLHVTQSI